MHSTVHEASSQTCKPAWFWVHATVHTQHTKDSGVPCYGVTQKVSQHHAAAVPDAPSLLWAPLNGVQPAAQFSADLFLTIRSHQLLIWSLSQPVITLLISVPNVSFWTIAFSYKYNVCKHLGRAKVCICLQSYYSFNTMYAFMSIFTCITSTTQLGAAMAATNKQTNGISCHHVKCTQLSSCSLDNE